jgi:hypothetical protein
MNFTRQAKIILGAAAAVAMSCGIAGAHRHIDPLPGQQKHAGPYRPPYKAPPGSISGTWTPLTNPFPGRSFPDTAQLLTDGTVIMHDGCTKDWYRLTPDNTGHYQNGTWKQAASMPGGYLPLYFASQVLPDGRMIVNGGEYNLCNYAWTNRGALYDPVRDKWFDVKPPTGWHYIGDAQSVVLADGTYMLANCCTAQAALGVLDKNTVVWTPTGSGKADGNDEEGWTMLPDETIQTIDVGLDVGQDFNDTEIYSQVSGIWVPGNHTADVLADPTTYEIGPAPLLPSGLVMQLGATHHTGIYDPATGVWTAGPDFPDIDGSLDASDAPAAVLPDGNILAQVSPGSNTAPSHFLEIRVNSPSDVVLTQVSEPESAPLIASFESRMLLLPTGEVFWSADAGDVEIYTPQGEPKSAWRPVIRKVASTIAIGSRNNVVRGKRFNGLTLGAYYGDDAQMATNYPLVRITNVSSGHVCFARTHDHSTMGISGGKSSSTKFDVPATCEAGASSLEVVANGIVSPPVSVTLN